jgi:hypothetical protein
MTTVKWRGLSWRELQSLDTSGIRILERTEPRSGWFDVTLDADQVALKQEQTRRADTHHVALRRTYAIFETADR